MVELVGWMVGVWRKDSREGRKERKRWQGLHGAGANLLEACIVNFRADVDDLAAAFMALNGKVTFFWQSLPRDAGFRLVRAYQRILFLPISRSGVVGMHQGEVTVTDWKAVVS